MEIIVILALILLNGILSMTEMAFVSSRKYRQHADDRFLSTIQIGITLISILTGLFSGGLLSDDLAAFLSRWKPLHNNAYWISNVLIVTVVTYLTLVMGELVPKRLGMMAADKIARAMSGLMKLLRQITYPFVWLLTKSTRGIMMLFGLSDLKEAKVTEDEIKALIEEGREDGEIRQVEQELVERVFNLGDRTIDSVMTHRSDLIWLDINDPIEMNIDIVHKNLHGIYPVADEDLDQLMGVVYMKDLFGTIDKEGFDLRSVVHMPLFIPENLSVYAAVEQMRLTYSKYALVTDEFGSIQGMVTHSDIMEAIIGELPENKEDHDIVPRGDGSFLIDGQCDFYAFLEHFDMEDLAAGNDYNTLSGLILDKLEHVPVTGETFLWEGLSIEVVDMDIARIDKVLVRPVRNISQD
ncbi:MAG: hemolysin family protein [Bacteroidales bacterium]|jgi:putative hemolysin|nr:hemolysin family protein [Bacteroidales bacterium]MDD3640023.1 hemolysin family protein [Bacteroidales bacterium]MDD4481321.1 hemolysin family protein [Bacteroidales bacterium]MDD5315336.1 hemolysin family protein [Bacteroidales bacterium]MDD5714449.1 hemolysin family protein [Bacteroidales bacterium]